MQLIHNQNSFLRAASVEKWQVMIRKRLSNNRPFYMSMVLIAKSLLHDVSNLEPCPICYCVLHPSTHSLPDRNCSHCVGRFHSSCLTTWLKNSQSHNCPLCRQPIAL